MSDQHLLLVYRPYYVAFWFNCDVVVLSKIFLQNADRGHFIHNITHVYAFVGDGLDDLMVVALKVSYILVGDAIFDKVIVMLESKLGMQVLSPRLVLHPKNVGRLVLLIVAFQYPLSLLMGEEMVYLFVESAFVVVEDVECFDHFVLLELIAQDN